MKNFKKGLLATAIILVSAGSAFATNVAKQKEVGIVQRFRYDPSQPLVKCIETPTSCESTGAELCTWTDVSGTHQMYEFINGTMCGAPLYKN